MNINFVKFKILLLSLILSIFSACSWLYDSDEPTREERLLMQEQIIKHQNDELKAQEKEKEDIERQNYHNKLLKRYE